METRSIFDQSDAASTLHLVPKDFRPAAWPPHSRSRRLPLKSLAMAVTCGDIPRLICSVIIPPIGVYFQVGCTKDLAINVLLTLLGYVPGLIHAIYILVKE